MCFRAKHWSANGGRLAALGMALVLALGSDRAPCEQESHEAENSPQTLGAVCVSQRMIELFFAPAMEFDEAVDVAGVSLGSARTRASARVTLVPDAHAGHLRIDVEGTLEWLVAATTQPAGAWNYSAHQQIRLGQSEVTMQPVVIDAIQRSAQQPADGSSALFGDVWQRIRTLQDERVSRGIEERLDRRVRQFVETAPARVTDQHWIPYELVETLRHQLQWSTASDHVQLRYVSQSNDAKVVTGCPVDDGHDFQVLFHEAAVEAISEQCFGGKRVDDEVLMRHVERMRGSVPWELWVHDRRLPWSFTWQRTPVDVSFSGGEACVILRGCQVQIGHEAFHAPFEILASYAPVIEPSPHFRRTDGPTVKIASDHLTGDQEDRLVRHLQRKFDAVFPAEVYFDGITPPVGGSWNRFHACEMVRFSAEDSWFVVGFRRRTTP